jgi:phosphoglycolate phosphatase-like HAD superfamily hydrolase
MLALFDLDGTLLQLPSRIHQLAIERASSSVFGVELKVPETIGTAWNGLTTPMLGQVLLRSHGVPDGRIEGSWPAWKEAMITSYLDLQQTVTDQLPFPDAGRALDTCLDEGWRVGLLTGNYRLVAEAKLRAAGIWRSRFDMDQGAFGDDAADRDHLGLVASRRASQAGMGENVIVIGDTPRDISCAQVMGCRSIAVTTGGFTAEQLAAADAVVDSVWEATERLLEWK